MPNPLQIDPHEMDAALKRLERKATLAVHLKLFNISNKREKADLTDL
jgi:hypothetical protein